VPPARRAISAGSHRQERRKPASKIDGLMGSQSLTMVRFRGSGIAADFADKAGIPSGGSHSLIGRITCERCSG